MVYKYIIFDISGVVINSIRFSEQYSKQSGVPLSTIVNFIKGDFESSLLGRSDLKEILRPRLKEFKWEGNVDSFIDRWFDMERDIDKRIIDLIAKLKRDGFKVIAATNQERYRADYLKYKMGFSEVFDELISSSDLGIKKPDKEFFLSLMQKMRIKPKESIFIDDSKDNIESAISTGIDSILYINFEDLVENLRIRAILL